MTLPSRPNKKEAILSALSSPERNGHAPIQILATDLSLAPERTIDALALDDFGRLALILLGPKDEASWISTILDSLAWLEDHRDLLRKRFSLDEKDRGLPPRALLIAPEFSSELLRRLGLLRGLDLAPLEAVWSQMEGEKRVRFRPLPRPSRTSETAFPDWALHPLAAALLREAVEKIRKIDSEIEVDWAPGQAELLYRGRPIGVLRPGSRGLRILVALSPALDLEATDRPAFVRGLDGIFRRYVDMGIEALPEATEKTEEILPSVPPTRGRSLLTQEEIEAITK